MSKFNINVGNKSTFTTKAIKLEQNSLLYRPFERIVPVRFHFQIDFRHNRTLKFRRI